MPYTASPAQIAAALKDVRDQSSFINRLLIETHQWPVADGVESIEDISYGWSQDELRASGLDRHVVDGQVLQIQPLATAQPWGIFLLEFQRPDAFITGRGVVGPLRAVLRGLVPNRRKSAGDKSWKREHLLFLCTHNYEHFRVAYFKAPPEKTATAPLAAFGWGPDIPARTACEFNLPALTWPESPADAAAWVSQWASAFDVEKVTKKFYEDYAAAFADVERLIGDKCRFDDEDLRMFTQTLFNRLMFLRFIERKGWLDFHGRPDYLRALSEAGGIAGKSLYQSRIRPLFFEALAVEGKQESDAVGRVPFLNGGLFEETDLDRAAKDVPDKALSPMIGPTGLFYRYNFTIEESTPLDIEVAVDPEMLGKVFEELVTARQKTGAYYTPRHIVSFMCRESLKAFLGGFDALVDETDTSGISVPEARQLLESLQNIRVCDPACGSGAYLMGMLHELQRLSAALDTAAHSKRPVDAYNRRQHIITNNLFGVDVSAFAVNIAKLRLWLSLAVEFSGAEPPPLPHLDYNIELGDSLACPDPNAEQLRLHAEALKRFRKLKAEYAAEHRPERLQALQGEINELRSELFAWVRPGQDDLCFDWAVDFADVLGDGGFDIVVANPPYGILCKDPLRFSYFPRDKKTPKQAKDSYGLFIARGLQLLRDAGQMSVIVSDTWRTIQSHLPLRKQLLTRTTLRFAVDLPSWVFGATVNTCILALTQTPAPPKHRMITGDLRNLPRDDWATLRWNLIAVAGKGFDLQTLTYARYTSVQSEFLRYDNLSIVTVPLYALKMMAAKGAVRFRDIADVKVGLQTGENAHYLRKRPSAQGSYTLIDDRLLLRESELARLTDDERSEGVSPDKYAGRHFVPYDKGGHADVQGGWLPRYLVPTEFFIDWSRKAVRRMKSHISSKTGRIASRFQNAQYYFQQGLTWSDAGYYSPTLRLSGKGVFDVKGSRILLNDDAPIDVYQALGILNSTLIRYLVKAIANHTVSTQVDDLSEVPLPDTTRGELSKIGCLVQDIITKQRKEPRYAYHLNEQRDIDKLIYVLYDLPTDAVREVDLYYCRRYGRLAEAQGVLQEIAKRYATDLARSAVILSRPPSYWSANPTAAKIAAGESANLEFKSCLEADPVSGTKSKTSKDKVLRAISGFLNTAGGTLVIGVSDDGKVVGIQQDIAIANRGNIDGFEQKLRDLMSSLLKPAPTGHVSIEFEPIDSETICVIEVQPSDAITYWENKVIVRDGNTSRELQGADLVAWLGRRTAAGE